MMMERICEEEYWIGLVISGWYVGNIILILSRYHPHIITHHPDITHISSIYHPHIIQISSIYITDIIQISPTYHLNIILILHISSNITHKSSKYHPYITHISSKYHLVDIFYNPQLDEKSRLTQIWHEINSVLKFDSTPVLVHWS